MKVEHWADESRTLTVYWHVYNPACDYKPDRGAARLSQMLRRNRDNSGNDFNHQAIRHRTGFICRGCRSHRRHDARHVFVSDLCGKALA